MEFLRTMGYCWREKILSRHILHWWFLASETGCLVMQNLILHVGAIGAKRRTVLFWLTRFLECRSRLLVLDEAG
jgi:hypothetical protein